VVDMSDYDDSFQDNYDVVVVGGGAAGLNGALMLVRARRSVLVIDAGEPRNAPAAGVHGLLARDGTSPTDLLAAGRAEVRGYGGQVVRGSVAAIRRAGVEFAVCLDGTRSVLARRVLVATGVRDELPDIPGLREHWGRDLVHCPYCHGWEVRDRAIGVLAGGPVSVHQALLFRQLSADVTYFARGGGLAEADAERFAALGIRVVATPVASVETVADRIAGVRLANGELVSREVLTVAPRAVPRVDFLAPLGIRPVPHPSGMGEHVPADPVGRTEVPGLWIAGNATDIMAQVGAAAAAGAMAGAQINAELVTEDAEAAVAAYRAPFSAAAERRVSELVLGDRRHGLRVRRS
jgi:thioredoxin reductase